MIPGASILGADALAEVPPDDDLEEITLASVLAEAATSDWLIALEARPLALEGAQQDAPYALAEVSLAELGEDDEDAASDFGVYLATRAFTTAPDETPANRSFLGRLLTSLHVETRIPVPGSFDPRGRQVAGTLSIANGDGRLDALVRRSWEGRDLWLRLGGTVNPRTASERVLAYAQFPVVFRGMADRIEGDESRLRLALRSRAELLETPLAVGLFAAGINCEAGSDLDGRPLPVLLGEAYNVPLPLTDSASLTYRVSARAIEAVLAVRDNGVPLAPDGDMADVSAWSPVAGRYVTSLANAEVRLGAEPAGLVTVDARGDNVGGYVASALDVARRVVSGFGPLADPDDLDAVAFAAASLAAPQAVGFWSGIDAVPVASVVDQLLLSVDGWWTFGRTGLLTVGLHGAPSEVEDAGTLDVNLLRSANVVRQPAPSPVYRVRVGWRRMWAIQDGDALGDIGAAGRELYARAYRYAAAEDLTAAGAFPLARDVELPTLLVQQADAEALAATLVARYGRLRHLWQVPLIGRALFRLKPGQGRTLQAPRFGLDAGERVTVVAFEEDADVGAVNAQLWG